MGLLQGLIHLLQLGQVWGYGGTGDTGVMEPGGAWRQRHGAAGTWVGMAARRLQEGLAGYGGSGWGWRGEAGAQAAGGGTRIKLSAAPAGWVVGKSPQPWAQGRGVWVGAMGVGEELQPSSVPQPCHPCCQVVLGLLGTCLAMAVWSWGCEVIMLGPELLEAPVLISLCLWGGGQGDAGGLQPAQALLLPHPSPGDRRVVWAGQAADRRAGAAPGPSPASLQTPQMPNGAFLAPSWAVPWSQPRVLPAPTPGAGEEPGAGTKRLWRSWCREGRQRQIPGTMRGAGSTPGSGFYPVSPPECCSRDSLLDPC